MSSGGICPTKVGRGKCQARKRPGEMSGEGKCPGFKISGVETGQLLVHNIHLPTHGHHHHHSIDYLYCGASVQNTSGPHNSKV
jgi:hypothetical protein